MLVCSYNKQPELASLVEHWHTCWGFSREWSEVSAILLVVRTCSKNEDLTSDEENIVAWDIKFVSLVCTLLQDSNVINVTDLKSAYSDIRRSNGCIAYIQLPLLSKRRYRLILMMFTSWKWNATMNDVRVAAMEDSMTKTTNNNIRQLYDSVCDKTKHPSTELILKSLYPKHCMLLQLPTGRTSHKHYIRDGTFCHITSRCFNDQPEHYVLV